MTARGLKKLKKIFCRYINGTKGVISLFLAILMVPFVMLTGALIDAARVRSTIAIFDEALCNASNSTLGTYDEFLKKRFGLLAIAQSTGIDTYNTQDLLADTFDYYMQENLKTLNGAYTSYSTEALGVYPLSEKEVLRTEITEYSKYTVPAKLLINGLSIDSIVSSLTSSMRLATSTLDCLTSSVDVKDKFEACQDKFDDAIEAAKDCDSKPAKCTAAFSEFQSATAAYNKLVAEMLAARRRAEAALQSAQAHQSDCQDDFDRAETAVSDVLQTIENLQNETDAAQNPVDNSAQIAAIREEHKAGLDAYDQASDALETAKAGTSSAESALEGVNTSYSSSLGGQRKIVGQKRDAYAAALEALEKALEQTGKAVKAAQDAMKEAEESGRDFGSQILDTSFDFSNETSKKAIEEMEQSRKDAWARGDHEAGYLWGGEIENAQNNSNKFKNAQTIMTNSDASIAASKFTEHDYLSEFQACADTVRELKERVKAYPLASGDDYMEGTDSYRLDITLPLDKDDLEKIQKNLAAEIGSSSLISMLKFFLGFVEAIKKMSLVFNPKLNSDVEIANIRKNSVGASKPGALTSDSKLSAKYKELYGGVSTNTPGEQSIALDKAIDKLIGYIDRVNELLNPLQNVVDKVMGIFEFIANFVSIVADVIYQVKTIVNNIGRIGEVAYGRLLLAGYVGYNTANRTNYDEKGLTGASFNTAPESSGSKALLCGAETEYILTGYEDELKSQTRVFRQVYQLRLVMNAPFVMTNQEVASIASAAGAATFGVGTAIVYIMYLLLEPLVDTILLVNSSSVPVFKTTLYLSPSGVVSLVESISSLKLSSETRTSLRDGCIHFMSAGTVSDDYSRRYAEIIQSGVSDPDASKPSKVLDAVNMTYTKIMILLLLFRSSDETLGRLADVIQMEASNPNADDGGSTKSQSSGASGKIPENTTTSFSLNNSYTYIRASGEFSGGYLFSPDSAPWTSNNQHIVYRGY